MYNMLLYSTAQYITVQYGMVQYSTVQCSTVQYSAVQYSTVRYNTVKYIAVQHRTVQYNTVQCSWVRYNIVQYNTVQYSTVQYSTVQYSTMSVFRFACEKNGLQYIIKKWRQQCQIFCNTHRPACTRKSGWIISALIPCFFSTQYIESHMQAIPLVGAENSAYLALIVKHGFAVGISSK